MSVRTQSTGWKHLVYKHVCAIALVCFNTVFDVTFWLPAELVKLTSMCCFCTVRACKKIQKQPLYKSPPLSCLKIEGMLCLLFMVR